MFKDEQIRYDKWEERNFVRNFFHIYRDEIKYIYKFQPRLFYKKRDVAREMRQSIKDIFRYFPIRVYGKVILEHEAIVKPAKNQCKIFSSATLVPKINEADVS